MAGTIQSNYGAVQTITCTIAGLGGTLQRQSAAITNGSVSSIDYTDCLVGIEIGTPASVAMATSPYVDVYAYGMMNGTNYTGGCTGSDAAYASASYPLANLPKLGRLTFTSLSTGVILYGGPWSLAMAFGGNVPTQWGLVLDNELFSTSSGAYVVSTGSAWYTGVYGQYT